MGAAKEDCSKHTPLCEEYNSTLTTLQYQGQVCITHMRTSAQLTINYKR